MGDNCRPTGFVSSGQVNGLTGTVFVDTKHNLVRLTTREFQRPHGTAVTMTKSEATHLANLLSRDSATPRRACQSCADRGYVLQAEKSTVLYIRKCAQCNRYRNNSEAQRAAYSDAVAGQARKEGGSAKPHLRPIPTDHKARNFYRLGDFTRVCDALAVTAGKYC